MLKYAFHNEKTRNIEKTKISGDSRRNRAKHTSNRSL